MRKASYFRAQNVTGPIISNPSSLGIHEDNGLVYDSTNIMFDARVCRGNTYAKIPLTETQRWTNRLHVKTKYARIRSLERRCRERNKRRVSPPPVRGRKHASTQTKGGLNLIFRSRRSEFSLNQEDESYEEELKVRETKPPDSSQEYCASVAQRNASNGVPSKDHDSSGNKDTNNICEDILNVFCEGLAKDIIKLAIEKSSKEIDVGYYSSP